MGRAFQQSYCPLSIRCIHSFNSCSLFVSTAPVIAERHKNPGPPEVYILSKFGEGEDKPWREVMQGNCFLLLLLFGHTTWYAEFPQPGVKHKPPAVEVQNFNHWTTREVQRTAVFIRVISDGFSEKQRREGGEDWSLGSLKKGTEQIEHQGPWACGRSVPGIFKEHLRGWDGWSGLSQGEQSRRRNQEMVLRETRMVPSGSLCKDFGFVL